MSVRLWKWATVVVYGLVALSIAMSLSTPAQASSKWIERCASPSDTGCVNTNGYGITVDGVRYLHLSQTLSGNEGFEHRVYEGRLQYRLSEVHSDGVDAYKVEEFKRLDY